MKSLMIGSVTVLVLWWCESVNAVMFGQVQSPRYPKPYPADENQQWDLDVPPGYQIQLTFTYMDIEFSADCFYDYLQVLHGKKVLGRFCGQNYTDPYHPGNRPILSPDNRLQLVFVTDDSNPGPQQPIGFSAFYQAVDVDECSSPVLEDTGPICSHICLNTLGSYQCACRHGYHLKADQHTCVLDCGGGTSTESEGTLTSPGYPSSSPLTLDCMYNISVEPGFEITLNFSHLFHIEQIYNQGPTCLYHWLQVSIPGEKPRKFCGDKSPGILHTGASSVQLEYHTDNMGQSRGWSIHYSTQRVECKIRSIINGRVTPDFPKYFYRDYIHVRCDLGHKLMMGGKEIPSFRSMCQQNGRWHFPLPECMIIDCGAPIPLLNGGVRFLSGSNNEYRAIIQYHCNKPFYTFRDAHYVNFTCASNRKWLSSDDNAIIPPCDPVCGRPTVELFSRDRVFGGKDAPAGSFPWQAFIRTPGQRGGAFVIGDRWLLTAAHVLEKNGKENVQVYVGNNKITELMNSPPLAIDSVHMHPGYKNNDDRTNFDNDIALMKLNSSITFNADVMPVCVPPQGAELNTAGWVSGFGSTEDWSSANTLRYISLPLVDQNVCHTWLEKERTQKTNVAPLTANMFCAGYPEGIKDTCSGDSGSAFVMRKDEYYWAAGIVSWGVDCGKPGKYGMYTRVTQYADWIQKTMEEN